MCLPSCPFEILGATAREHDRIPFTGERQRDRLADAAAGAGHHCDFLTFGHSSFTKILLSLTRSVRLQADLRGPAKAGHYN